MDSERILPWPRGQTLEEGNTNIIGATNFKDLLGRAFKANDTVHGTGRDVWVMPVKNASGSAITVERRCVRFDTDAGEFMRYAAGYNNAAGGLCLPIDDAMAEDASIAANETFYVIVKGPCYVKSEATSVNRGAGAVVTVDDSGYLEGAAPGANDFILGRNDAATTDTSTNTLIYVDTLVGGEGT